MAAEAAEASEAVASEPLISPSLVAAPAAEEDDAADKALNEKIELVLARFNSSDDLVAQEFESLGNAFDVDAVEKLIEDYSAVEESLQTRLGAHLIANYDGFMRGMQHVQQVDIEFAVIGMKIRNSRRRLRDANAGIADGGYYIARQKQRQKRLGEVIEMLAEVRALLEEQARVGEFAAKEKFHDAIKLNARLLHTLRSEKFRPGGSLDSSGAFGDLREGLRCSLEEIKQTLRNRMMEAAARAEVDFDTTRYEEVLEACGATDFSAL
mmetsp:Transcript_9376/g.20945  ORF Transcript_9376/g.20945 Transcript_9376/m.20945 type:complete len:267 (+) Transcript_9376:82-882(+)